MSKKALKVAAVLAILCFVLSVAPVLNSAEKKPVKVMSFLQKPVLLLCSILGIYPPVIIGADSGDTSKQIISLTSSKGIIKTTGDDSLTPPPNKKD